MYGLMIDAGLRPMVTDLPAVMTNHIVDVPKNVLLIGRLAQHAVEG